MAIFPGVQKKAQADRHRLPTTDDLENLPYVNAVSKEVLRWQPVKPLGRTPFRFGTERMTECMRVVPARLLMRDDEYRGYRIPKGAIVLGNVW
jgi:cytochrome P450